MGIEENKAVFVKFLEEVIHNKNTEMIFKLVDANRVSHNARGGEGHGVERYKNSIETVSRAFPDIHYDVERMIAEGDFVCTCLRASATHQGEFMGIKPTGKTYSWGEVAISRFKDGKIVEDWQYLTSPGLVDQLKESASE